MREDLRVAARSNKYSTGRRARAPSAEKGVIVPGRLGLVLGNGAYAHELHTKLARSHDPVVATLLPRDLSSVTRNVDLYGSAFDLETIIRHLADRRVTHVIFGGDLGIYTKGLHIAKELLKGGILRKTNLAYLFGNFPKISIVTLLQYAELRLRNEGIEPILASALLPDLKPDPGWMSRGDIDLPAPMLDQLVDHSRRAIKRQPRLSVRHVVAFDNEEIIGMETESTDGLLRQIRKIEKRTETLRSIVKLPPSDISPTLDAPVIGPDTIDHCYSAHVDLVVVDATIGIITQKEHTLRQAKSYGIALFGHAD